MGRTPDARTTDIGRPATDIYHPTTDIYHPAIDIYHPTTKTANGTCRLFRGMTDDRQARWTHFEDAPDGALESDRFAEFRKPLAGFGAENLDLSLIEVAPGESGPLHAHEGSVEEFYVVLEGAVDVEFDDEAVRGRPGTVFFFPPGVAHRPFNDADEPARFVTMRAGEGERTVLE